MILFFYSNFIKLVILSSIFFFLGLFGIFITRRNIILILMSIEILFLSIHLLFIIVSIYIDDILGQVFSLYILTVIASESAIGLSLIVIFYRLRGVISVDFLSILKG